MLYAWVEEILWNLWWLGLLAPVAVAAATIAMGGGTPRDRLQAGLVGVLAAIVIGAVSSYLGSRAMLSAIGYGHVSYDLIEESWNQMWYPLVLSLVSSILIVAWAVAGGRTYEGLRR